MLFVASFGCYVQKHQFLKRSLSPSFWKTLCTRVSPPFWNERAELSQKEVALWTYVLQQWSPSSLEKCYPQLLNKWPDELSSTHSRAEVSHSMVASMPSKILGWTSSPIAETKQRNPPDFIHNPSKFEYAWERCSLLIASTSLCTAPKNKDQQPEPEMGLRARVGV